MNGDRSNVSVRQAVAPSGEPPTNGFVLPEDAESRSRAGIQRILERVRHHLGVDVVFIGEVTTHERVFRFVDSKPDIDVIKPGDSDPLEESYCFHVLSGDLPNYLLDPANHPVASRLPATTELPVGTHLSVPIRTASGRVYGTLCCFSLKVDRSAQPQDVRALELIAELTGDYLEAIDRVHEEHRVRKQVIESVLADPDGLAMVFQPLRDLKTMEVVGVEALSRFPKHDRGPDWFFSEAADFGLGVELEMRAVRAALGALDRIPDRVRLNLNVSPETLYTDAFLAAVADVPQDRLVVEVTEHAAIDDYTQLRSASARLTNMGIWLAIDDVGMGFSGLNRILETFPDELKLDAAVIRNVDTDAVKHALVEAFVAFGRRASFNIVAEGIETQSELQAVQDLGVGIGQGYLLGRPAPLGTHTWT